jgi:hypothetical protein
MRKLEEEKHLKEGALKLYEKKEVVERPPW